MEGKSLMNIYNIIYKNDEGFEIIKDKIEYYHHAAGYFSTISGDKIHLCYINTIPENINYSYRKTNPILAGQRFQ